MVDGEFLTVKFSWDISIKGWPVGRGGWAGSGEVHLLLYAAPHLLHRPAQLVEHVHVLVHQQLVVPQAVLAQRLPVPII